MMECRCACRAAPHYTGDGNTLHQTTQELLVLLGSAKTNHELELELEKELQVDAVRGAAPAEEWRLRSSLAKASGKLG
jgi:hypothetical protein